jgi:hypothetical protein
VVDLSTEFRTADRNIKAQSYMAVTAHFEHGPGDGD